MKELMITPFDGKYLREVDAFSEYGVRMGDDFINTLLQPAPMKDVIQNNSRMEHGVRVNIVPYQDKRSITLTFIITNGNGKSMLANLRNFQKMLYNVRLKLRVPKIEENVSYKLIYTGKSISYGVSIDRTISKLSVKFEEPNPSDRS